MTTAAVTVSSVQTDPPGFAYVCTWGALSATLTGDPIIKPAWSDRSVQVSGTFGSGGTCVIEGSNDGTNYVTLTDPQGNALSFTSARIEQIEEITTYLRPRTTAGDGTTAIVVTVLLTGARKM